MNNRQSRLPYNERAFSPQRMMNSSSNINQQSDPFDDPSSRIQQAIYQLQNELGRNNNFTIDQRNQSDFESGWYRNERNNERNDLGLQNRQCGYSGYDAISNQNNSNTACNSQLSNFTSNLTSIRSSEDMMRFNLDSRSQISNFTLDRQSDTNYRLSDQQRSDYGSSSQQRSTSRSYNSAWESGQNAFDERLSSRNERIRDERRREQDVKSSSQKSREDSFSSRGASRDLNSLKEKPRSSGRESKPASSSTNEQRAKIEKFPDIGEPKIKPKFEDLFDLVRKEDNGTSIYSCKICKINCLPDKNVPTHLAGKKHKYFLKLFEDSLPGKTKYQKEKYLREVVNEKNYNHKPMFELIISSITQPLVALEYVVEVLDSKAREQLYFCVLCDKRCDPRTIEKHLVSQTHRINYLSKHFESIMTQLQAFRRFNEDLEFRQKILNTICSRIEVKSGRSSAFVYEGNDFHETKPDISESINMKKHITIDDISNVEDYLFEGIKLNDPKWESENEPKPPREPLELPASVRRKRKVPENVLEEYKSAVDYAKKAMENKLREYVRDPDSHPKYKVEWELFWNKKIDEMSRRGEDSTSHNFHDEWCEFFVRRMRELHEDEVKWKVDQIRRNLGLTKDDVGEKSDNLEPKRSRNDRDRSLSNRRGRYNDNDKDNDSFDEDFRKSAPKIPKEVPFTKEKKIYSKFLHEVGIDQNKRPKPQPILIERREPIDRTMPKRSPPRSNEPTTLITTCRLLTSLETELGLLAQKVLDLLSKSIAFEREHSKSSDELLFENENLILIETVKEKIIGMQMAHLITQNKTKAVEKAVNEIIKLIGQHEVMINIKKTLKEMGKDEAAPEEIEMLKAMFMKKKNDKNIGDKKEDSLDAGRRQRRRSRGDRKEDGKADATRIK
ncbi:uncharacterized protein CG7065-like [Chironomus tepperi]|uniref:uncharacterized protein CG7065-like n=1 Tax=Chironomus tepperi TaxID=113505 RepID=UPI00391F6ABD